jgi:hypothetical protein
MTTPFLSVNLKARTPHANLKSARRNGPPGFHLLCSSPAPMTRFSQVPTGPCFLVKKPLGCYRSLEGSGQNSRWFQREFKGSQTISLLQSWRQKENPGGCRGFLSDVWEDVGFYAADFERSASISGRYFSLSFIQ